MFEKIKDYYDQGLWGEPRVRGMVIRRILTPEEYGSIIGEPIGDWEPDDGTMRGATETADGKKGLVPAPGKGAPGRFLRSDGIWTPADGGDADLVDGFHASQEDIAETAVVRGTDGSVQVGRIISDTPNGEDPIVSQVIVNDGTDGQYKKASLAHFKRSLYLDRSYTFVCYHPDRSGYTDLLEIDSRYSAHPILLEVAKRGGGVVRIYAVLKDEDIVVFRRTPVLGSVDPNGYKDSPSVYLAKTAAYKYDLYIHMPNGYGAAVVHMLSMAPFEEKNIIQSSLPTGYITPTEIAYIP